MEMVNLEVLFKIIRIAGYQISGGFAGNRISGPQKTGCRISSNSQYPATAYPAQPYKLPSKIKPNGKIE